MTTVKITTSINASPLPVVVDLWAPWCGPCRMVRPILEKLSRDYQGKVNFIEVNADEEPEFARSHSVMSIPTLLVFKDGKMIKRIVGAKPSETYAALFADLAEGKTEIEVSMPASDRLVRLSAGGLLILVAVLTSTWWLAALGGVVMFTGVYDRCPIWRALTTAFRKNAVT